MPIKMKLIFTNGWKALENERFGDVMVVRFLNSENNQTLFDYAPRCEDVEFFDNVFDLLEKYDNFLMELKAFKNRYDEK